VQCSLGTLNNNRIRTQELRILLQLARMGGAGWGDAIDHAGVTGYSDAALPPTVTVAQQIRPDSWVGELTGGGGWHLSHSHQVRSGTRDISGPCPLDTRTKRPELEADHSSC
jgi:hypothetical protein